MAKIEKIEDIESILVHWSESGLINDEMGCDENFDIEKQIDPIKFNDLICRAAKEVDTGYDKTVLSISLKNGVHWCNNAKFYLTQSVDCLMDWLNKGE